MRSAIAVVLVFASFQNLHCLHSVLNSRLNYFDIDLLRYAAEGMNGNVMISPASIKSTLAMLMDGARGATASEIRTALRLSPMENDYREELRLFLKALEANSSSVSLQNANGLFVSNKLKLKKEYETMAKRVYLSDVHKLDFNYPKEASDAINGWVSDKTKGLIPHIVDEANIKPTTELFVTNALYFKSSWMYQFEPSFPDGDCFYKDGVCKPVAMMNLDAELNYAYVDNLSAHALELPYQGNRHSMILLLPQDRDEELALIRDLPFIGLLQISDLMKPRSVSLTMPKFTVEYNADMVATLRNMRITTIFSPSANLSGILEDTTAYLNSIFHSVYMSVNEKGTVAAAATVGMLVPRFNDVVELLVDRPFLFFIRDNDSGLILFEGRIDEPTEYVAVHNRIGETQNKYPQPISTITQTNPPRADGSTPSPFAVPIQKFDNKPKFIQSSSSTPIASPPTPKQPISTQPILRHYTTTSSTKIETSWYKRFTSFFG